MHNDQSLIKRNLEINLLNKFGEQIKNDIFSLADKILINDTYINNNLWLSLQNILPLKKCEASYFATLAHELASASIFAPILLLEKIPTLSFYGMTEEIGKFLLNIKNYGARAVALFLGSDETNTLRVEDLVDVLEQSTLSFYKALLDAVNARHHEFGVCCAMIMRFSAKIETVISVQDIDTYLDVCSSLVKRYGKKITEKYIRNAHDFIPFISLEGTLPTLEHFEKKSLAYVEFAVTFPKIIFTSQIHSKNKIINDGDISAEEIRNLKVKILKTEDYLNFLENPLLFTDENFSSLIMSWPTLSTPVKSNILFQLEKESYKNFILTTPEIDVERDRVNQVTHSNWLKSWTFCGEVIDLIFIRKRLRNLLQQPKNFSLEAKTIVKKHESIFDRSNPEYSHDRVLNMINILLSYCVDSTVMNELSAMADFILGNHTPLKNILSKTSLVIQTWERNPWIDYARSDELFSCTSLGDYNSGNAPGFLSDLNLNNLDIWSHGSRVGRIRLCLINDASNNTILLLDCVDGTERVIGSQKKFELIIAAVLEYARWLGIAQIKVNYHVDFNATPKKFIAHVEQIYQEQDRIDFISRFLSVSTSRKLIPYPCQTYLESFVKNNGAFVRGTLIFL